MSVPGADTGLYGGLGELFGIVADGRPTVNVPPYNGGLFVIDPEEALTDHEHDIAEFLSSHSIPDRHLARAVDRLARDPDEKTHGLVMIDYKSLGVRQLGSIYEGLLEFKLRIAPTTMAVCERKGTELVLPYDEAQSTRGVKIKRLGRGRDAPEHILPEGAVYLENSKHERKASGSYYTPEYIVNYIVEHTVGPVLEEKLEAIRPDLDRACKDFRRLKKAHEQADEQPPRGVLPDEEQLVESLFDFKVLDPAMGSGHFLVTAVDFVADRLIHFLNGFPGNPVERLLRQTRREIMAAVARTEVVIDEGKLTDVNLLKRHVLKRCVYGVDLNPMATELAKVSLWLHCFTLGAPLSFLDHHLKTGNSLIGELSAAEAVPESGQRQLGGTSPWDEFTRAVSSYMTVARLADATAEQVLSSRRQFREAEGILERHRQECNVLTARHFEGWSDGEVGGARQAAGDESRSGRDLFDRAQELAEERRFFHWPLEFPEAWYGIRPGAERVIAATAAEQAGFDAVVGNPPYLFGENVPGDIRCVEDRFRFAVGQYDVYWLFYDVIMRLLLRCGGRHGFIVPDAILIRDEAGIIRDPLTNDYRLVCLAHAGPVFDEPSVSAAIVVWEAADAGEHTVATARCHGQRMIEGRSVRQTALSAVPGDRWLVHLDPVSFELLTRVYSCAKPLAGMFRISRGEEAGRRDLFDNEGRDTEAILIGDDLAPLGFPAPSRHIQRTAVRKDRANYSSPKGLFVKTGQNVVATVDEAGLVTLQSVYNLEPLVPRDTLYFVMALLKTPLLTWTARRTFTEYKSVFPQFNQSTVGHLPIREADASQRTAPEAKTRLLADCSAGRSPEHAVALDLARRALVAHSLAVGKDLPPWTHEDFSQDEVEELRDFPGREDFVHDLLAELAQRMIDLNKAKYEEIGRFVGWLEQELAVDVEDLSGKTFIKAYYEHDFDELVSRLNSNRRKLAMPVDGLFSAQLREEYEASTETLRPLEDALEKTDRLIDQIVYRLYGLRDEEIAIVEESLER